MIGFGAQGQIFGRQKHELCNVDNNGLNKKTNISSMTSKLIISDGLEPVLSHTEKSCRVCIFL